MATCPKGALLSYVSGGEVGSHASCYAKLVDLHKSARKRSAEPLSLMFHWLTVERRYCQ